MSRLGLNTQVLSRCGSGWAYEGIAPVRLATPLCYGTRQVSTAPSKKKAQVVVKKEAKAARPPAKEKAKANSADITQPKKPSTRAAAVAPEQPVPVAEVPTATGRAETTRASESTNTAASVKEARSQASKSATKSHTEKPTKATTASTTDAPAPAASLAADKTGGAPDASEAPAGGGAKPRVDPSSPEYKRAARRWVSGMVAMPILIVTSYFLFNRCKLPTDPFFPVCVSSMIRADQLFPSGLGQRSEFGEITFPAPNGPSSEGCMKWRCLCILRAT